MTCLGCRHHTIWMPIQIAFASSRYDCFFSFQRSRSAYYTVLAITNYKNQACTSILRQLSALAACLRWSVCERKTFYFVIFIAAFLHCRSSTLFVIPYFFSSVFPQRMISTLLPNYCFNSPFSGRRFISWSIFLLSDIRLRCRSP